MSDKIEIKLPEDFKLPSGLKKTEPQKKRYIDSKPLSKKATTKVNKIKKGHWRSY